MLGLLAGEPDGGHLRIGEDDAGDAVVPGATGVAEDVVGDDPGLVHGDVGELHDPGDVADRPHPVGGTAVLVHGNGAVGVQLDTDGIKTQPVGARTAAGADDEDVPA